eukprot:scaffold187_cov266-Chaetoceros_neogracile.AAC.64
MMVGSGQILIQIGANDGKKCNVKIVKDVLDSKKSRAVLIEVCEKGQTLPFFIIDDQKLKSETKQILPHWVKLGEVPNLKFE